MAECDGLLLGDFEGLALGVLLADGECDALRLADGDAERDGVRLGVGLCVELCVGLCEALGVDVAFDVGAALGKRDEVFTADGLADRDGRGDRGGEWLGEGEGLCEASTDTTPFDPWPLPVAFSTAAPIR